MALVPAVLGKLQLQNSWLEDLDTISLTDVYERLIHGAIQ
jgi:hypothetical protein